MRKAALCGQAKTQLTSRQFAGPTMELHRSHVVAVCCSMSDTTMRVFRPPSSISCDRDTSCSVSRIGDCSPTSVVRLSSSAAVTGIRNRW